MGECEVVITTGGARAMLDRRVGEVMHPVVGPAVEATRLYVAPARLTERLTRGEVVVLDVGLGAGSNAIAAWRLSEARSDGARLTIVSFERCLDALRLALAPEHCEGFGLDGGAGEAARALLADGQHDTARTTWRLVHAELPGSLETAPAADVVFWDPFSPRANPELWSVAAFTTLRGRCRAGATVHTYSGATAVRSALLLAGFHVGVGEPTGAHKAATWAAVEPAGLERPLDRRWLERLGRSTAGFPADAPADAYRRVCEHPQFAAVG